ncbi:MAG: hypothetical protein H6861_03870 [Rhodospirillales bacterium]|nr:hypothetical protein [Rhodospirillales bacterium]
MTLSFILLLTAPAHAGFEETEASYYARHLQSCQSKAKDKWYHVFRGFSETVTDECCAMSVAAAQKAGGTVIDLDNLARAEGKPSTLDESCPSGQSKNMLKCPTSKHWCE